MIMICDRENGILQWMDYGFQTKYVGPSDFMLHT